MCSAVPLLALAGCLLLQDAPPACPPDCSPYGCDDAGACHPSCYTDSYCADGFVCGLDQVCSTPCEDAACDDGFTCDTTTNECHYFCIDDGDCQSGWHCCDYEHEDCGAAECDLD